MLLNQSWCFIFLVVFLFGCSSAANKGVYQAGMASWYGEKYHGRKTASGEIYNMNAMTAAHPRLPFGTKVKVVAKTSGRSVTVRINDRGPFVKKRIIDVSKAAAKKLGMIKSGEIPVSIHIESKR